MNNLEKAKELKERFENSKRICKSVNPEVWLVSEEYQFNMKTLEKLKELLEEIKKGCGERVSGTDLDGTYIECDCGDFSGKAKCDYCQEAIKICEEILK